MSLLEESESLSIPFSYIKEATKNFTTPIGKGGYGLVYKGELLLSGKLTTVAVKRLQVSLSGQGFKEFLTEIQLLTRYKHPNLISLVGFCYEGEEKILIYEYAEHGSLDKYLSTAENRRTLTWKRRLDICVNAARGLNYLHYEAAANERVIHRDIKSANVLLDQNWKAMISDLGLSKLGRANEKDTYLITNPSGTHGYCDPVYRKSGILTKESDVYSFGVVLFEVLCGRLCYIDVHNEHRFLPELAQRYYNQINEIMDPELQNQLDPDSLKKFSEIAFKCIHNSRKQRPSMRWVLKKLEELEKPLDLHEIKTEMNPIMLNPRAAGPEVSLIGIPGSNQGSTNSTFKGWPLTAGRIRKQPVEDGSLDNVESFLSHNDTDMRDTVSRCMDVSKDFTFTEVNSVHASHSKLVCCHFSPDGKLLASGGHDNKAVLWYTDSLRPKTTLEGHTSLITDVRFSSSMPCLATSSFDKTVRVWDADNPGFSLRTFMGHSAAVMSLDFHPNKDDLICSCDRDGEIRYWSVHNGSCANVFKGATGQVRFQPRLGRFLAATAENIISILDVETHAVRYTLQGHTRPIHSVCWDPSGEYLASVSEDSVLVWSFTAGTAGFCVHELSCIGNKFHSCVFHPIYASLLVIGCYQSLELWNMPENKTMTLSAHEGLIAGMALSTSTGLVASASHDKIVKLWK